MSTLWTGFPECLLFASHKHVGDGQGRMCERGRSEDSKAKTLFKMGDVVECHIVSLNSPMGPGIGNVDLDHPFHHEEFPVILTTFKFSA